MKKIITGLAASFLCLSAFAQTVTLLFRGSQSPNYRVMIDGSRYRSMDAVSSNIYNASTAYTERQKAIRINDLMPGSHKIEIYNTTNSRNNRGQLVYTNNFQLRPEYNMFIDINGNHITFSEKTNPAVNANGRYRTAMTDAGFQNVVDNVRRNRYQAGRITAIRNALASTDYFTTNQIRRLLTLVNSEAVRLDLAKTAYRVTADPTNYVELNSLFDNETNINTLNDYVRVQSNSSVNPSIYNDVPPYNNNARALLSAYEYDRLLNDLNANNYQSGKYDIIRKAFANSTYAFSTAQIRQLLGAINSESDRLYLARQAYATVSDKANFSTLLSLFDVQSNRADLNAYIINNGGTGGSVYRSARVPMQDANFNELLRNAGDHFLPWDKYKEIKGAFTDPANYFTSYQARQLMNLLSSGVILPVSEANRIELAKLAYLRITDPQNFSEVLDVFTDAGSRNELNAWLRIQNNY
jgi:hypothetical protein